MTQVLRGYAMPIAAAAAALAACKVYMPTPMESLPRRAAVDLGCPEAQLKTQQIDGTCDAIYGDDRTCTAAASGCGHQATYVFTHQNKTWVMNSTLSPAPVASQ
jgi:hypothetical protein